MNPTTEDQVAEEGEEGLVVMLPEVYLQLVLPVEVVLLDIMVPVTLQIQMPKLLAIVFFVFLFHLDTSCICCFVQFFPSLHSVTVVLIGYFWIPYYEGPVNVHDEEVQEAF